MKIKTPDPLDFNYLYDHILVEPMSLDGIDEDGLVRPRGYDDKPELGIVMRIGEGRIFDDGTVVPLKVKEGDIVYFNKYSSVKVRINTKDYLIIREDDIQGYKRGK